MSHRPPRQSSPPAVQFMQSVLLALSKSGEKRQTHLERSGRVV
jgi:hypothetical protein